MTQSLPRPVSTWSESLCKKLPLHAREVNELNAIWIMLSPIRLTSMEKAEVMSVIQKRKP